MELDAKAWDSNVLCQMLEKIRDMRWAWLARHFITQKKLSRKEVEVHRTRFYRLYQDLIQTLMKGPQGDLWRKSWGVVSGGSNTVNDNTHGLQLLMEAIWILIMGEDKSKEECLTEAEYGDDCLAAVADPEVRKLFSAKNVIKAAAEFGTVLCNEADEKHQDEDGYVSDAAATFLKKKSRWIGKYEVFTPSEPFKLMHSLCYSGKRNEDPVVTISRAVSVRNQLLGTEYFSVVEKYVDFLIRRFDAYPEVARNPEYLGAKSAALPLRSLILHYTGVTRLSSAPALETSGLDYWDERIFEKSVEVSEDIVEEVEEADEATTFACAEDDAQGAEEEAGAEPPVVPVLTARARRGMNPIICGFCRKPGHTFTQCRHRRAETGMRAYQREGWAPQPVGPNDGMQLIPAPGFGKKKNKKKKKNKANANQTGGLEVVQFTRATIAAGHLFLRGVVSSANIPAAEFTTLGTTPENCQLRVKSVRLVVRRATQTGVMMGNISTAALTQQELEEHVETRTAGGDLDFLITGTVGAGAWDSKRVHWSVLGTAGSVVECTVKYEATVNNSTQVAL